jgi:hypothetical protein
MIKGVAGDLGVGRVGAVSAAELPPIECPAIPIRYGSIIQLPHQVRDRARVS